MCNFGSIRRTTIGKRRVWDENRIHGKCRPSLQRGRIQARHHNTLTSNTRMFARMPNFGLSICANCGKQQRGHYPPLGSCWPTRTIGKNSTFEPKPIARYEPPAGSVSGRACQYIIAYEYKFEARSELYSLLSKIGHGYHFGRLPSSLYQGAFVNTEVVHCTFDYDVLGTGILLEKLKVIPWHFPDTVTVFERLPGELKFVERNL